MIVRVVMVLMSVTNIFLADSIGSLIVYCYTLLYVNLDLISISSIQSEILSVYLK